MAAESTAVVPGVPEEEPVFRFIYGRLCLAFCATVDERWRRKFEQLREPGDLARWVVAAGLVGTGPSVDEQTLADARALREAAYRLVRAAMAGQAGAAADLDVLNAWARRPALAPQVDRHGARHTAVAGTDPARACLATVARDAVDLLTGPEIYRVRECGAADCAALFVDRSRPGRDGGVRSGPAGRRRVLRRTGDATRRATTPRRPRRDRSSRARSRRSGCRAVWRV